uniref:Uncharacterized protein n=1 Tax=Setaria italica TaxID=4555 RepID=K4AGX4_SETIT
MLSEAELVVAVEKSESDSQREPLLPDELSLVVVPDDDAPDSEPLPLGAATAQASSSSPSSRRRQNKPPLPSRRERLLERWDSLLGRRRRDGSESKWCRIVGADSPSRRRG